MPLIHLTLSGSENLSLATELSKTISDLTATVLNKRPEVTVVTISFVPDHLWFINSNSLADLGKKSFHLSIRISDSTNLKNDKADYIAAVHNTISKILGDIHPVSYSAIDEMKADAYGYEGLTIEHKIIANKLNTLKNKSNLMKITILHIILLTFICQLAFAQQPDSTNKEILHIIDIYTKSVIERDSVAFYNLFNNETVVWCGAVTERSQQRAVAQKGVREAGNSYFAGSYKSFMRSLFRHKATEDKFDNIKVVQDGTVATLTMDYSFWADDRMTNWGSKYLSLIRRDGKWKIISIIYSLDLTDYYPQPTLKERLKN